MKFTYEPEARPLEGYTIKRAIDRGGFGEVYYALSDSGKEVALKFLQRNAEVELRGISQCLNLKHPNLITLFDVKTDAGGGQWVIMEYVSGKSLEAVLTQAPQGLPPQEAEKWLTQMAAGVGYLHDRGIVHRDLKPGNVFIENGIVKIGDVGLAKSMAPSHRSAHTESVGTVYYMAPEVSKGKYGHEIDVYSLGVMLYEMLSGQVPFGGESAGEILMKHLTEKPDLTRVPTNFRSVLARALAKDPLQRTPSAMELAKEFSAAVHGRSAPQELRAGDFVPPRPAPRQAPYVLTDADLVRKPQPLPKSSNPFAETTLEPIQPSRSRQATAPKPWNWYGAAIAAAVVMSLELKRGGPIKGAVAGLLVFGFVWMVMAFIRGMMQASRVPTPRPLPVQDGKKRISPYATTPETPRNLPLTFRIEDLTASMAKSTIWSITAAVALALTTPLFGGAPFEQPAKLGLFTLATILASWTILLPTKLMWEGTEFPASSRRFVMGALGAVVGACTFWLHQSLLIDSINTGHNAFDGLLTEVGAQKLIDASHAPTMAGYVMFFTALFALRRWWWRADSFRPTQFSIGSVALTVALGFLIPAVFAFPQDWAAAWAGSIACVVQLSSGYLPVKQRTPLLEAA